MTESAYQEFPFDHPFAGVSLISRPQEEESAAQINMRLENERLARTCKQYRLEIFRMAEEIRNLKAVLKH